MAPSRRTVKHPNCRRPLRLIEVHAVRPPSLSPRVVVANRAHGPTAGQSPPDPEAPATVQPLVLSVAEAAAALGVSDDLIYQLTDRGELPCLRVGRRKVIPRQAVEAVVKKAMYRFENG